jgi:hypothetical protein
MRTPVLAKMGGVCLFRSRSLPGVVIQLPAFGVVDGLAVGLPLLVHQVEPGDALPIGGWVLLYPSGGGNRPDRVLMRRLCRLIGDSGVPFFGSHHCRVKHG